MYLLNKVGLGVFCECEALTKNTHFPDLLRRYKKMAFWELP